METKTLLVIALVIAAAVGAVLLLVPEKTAEPDPTPTAAAEPTSAVEQPAVIEPEPAAPAVAPLPEAIDVQTPSVTAPVPAEPVRRVMATYFHNTARCYTCRTIEQLARQTIESTFSAELASGRLAWRALNMEEKANEHFAFDYELTSPSLVLAELDGENELRFKVLGETWKLVHTKVQFATYIESEVRAFLEGS